MEQLPSFFNNSIGPLPVLLAILSAITHPALVMSHLTPTRRFSASVLCGSCKHRLVCTKNFSVCIAAKFAMLYVL